MQGALYHNKRQSQTTLLNAVLSTLNTTHARQIKAQISQFKTPNFSGIDSLRFITTKAFLKRFTTKFCLNLESKKLNTQREIYANLGERCEVSTTKALKLTKQITIMAFYTHDTITKSRKSKDRLDNYAILSIHGLQQYDNQTKEPLKHDKQTAQILKYLLRYCNQSKERKQISLKSFDYALDYLESATISKQYALSKNEHLGAIKGVKFRQCKTTLYIQNQDSQKPLLNTLRKIKIYDKTHKNDLKFPLIRAELLYKID
ncbi:hypothetical protein [Campylobacter sp. JMF_08 NE1]|uniref:hypothetical protein n=1 Tax=Campylobacter sp. JMF_08 NE1 TaxID=2983821 RepID=UPI0022E9C435|nr:hypothetical protein [Campylobacter sp. JMF_08 NE1]MDA3048576.1 hypothetical protein [Campylobacter sp. JMF_08 NE1]